MTDYKIRKVRALGDRCAKLAKKMRLKANDMVLVSMTVHRGKPPTYGLMKIKGCPIDFLNTVGRGLTKKQFEKLFRYTTEL